MQKSIIALISGLSSAALLEGPCPTEYSYNKSVEEFDKLKMTGLWFEYVWDAGYDEHLHYKCSMWTLLKDGDNMAAFNHVQFADGEGKFASVDINWAVPTELGQPQHASYNRHVAHFGADETKPDKEMHMLFTNYYNYLVGKTC